MAAFLLLSLSFAAERPNIVVVLVDDLGYGDLSCYGGTLVATPALDRMAEQGVRFTQGYVASPICSPSRCGLLTGQNPGRWRINSFLQTRAGNKACESADYLDAKAPSLPRVLQASGYKTMHVGKWHLGGGRDVTDAPKFAAYGYDSAIGTWESPEPHPDLTSTNWIWAKSDKVPRHERTKWMIDRSFDFLDKHRGTPCFVNLWLDDTHTPYVPSEAQLAAVKKPGEGPEIAKYRAVMAALDIEIGRLMEKLKGTNTLVLVIGDNGAMPTFDQKRVAGLRGSKLSLYEGGIRVPFLAWWPGHAKPALSKTVISTLDLMPSLAKLCGAALPENSKSDGEDLSNAILGETAKRTKPLHWEYGRNEKSFAYPKDAKHRSPNVAIRDGDWKLHVNADGTNAELYDLAKDPKETANVIEGDREVAARLKTSALQWRKSLP